MLKWCLEKTPPPYTPHLPEHYPGAPPVSRFHDNHTTTVHHNRPVTESVLAFTRAVNSHSQWPRSHPAYWSRSQSRPMSSEGSMSAYVSAYVYQTRIHLSVSTVFIVAWIESIQIKSSLLLSSSALSFMPIAVRLRCQILCSSALSFVPISGRLLNIEHCWPVFTSSFYRIFRNTFLNCNLF